MGNFWKMMNIRWNRESMQPWGSLKKTIYILFPLLVYFLIHDMVEILIWGGLHLFMKGASDGIVTLIKENAYTVRGIVNGLAILCGVAVIWKGVKAEISSKDNNTKNKKDSAKEDTKEDAKETVKQSIKEKQLTNYVLLAALAFLSAFGLNLLFYLIGLTESSESFTQTAQAQFGVDFAIGLLLYGVLSPFAEEAVFRGFIYNRMKRCFTYPIALIVSSLLFGCYHGNLVQAVYGTALGLLIAYAYERYESFAAPVLFHGVSNVSIYVLTYGNKMTQIDKAVSIAMTAISLLGAAGCLILVRKKKIV